MSDENKAIALRVIEEVWNNGRLDVVDEVFAPDYEEHNPRPGQERGIDGYKSGVSMLRAAFPDLRLAVLDVVAEGDLVALRYALRGTQDGELMGWPGSGRQVASHGMVFARFEDGKIVERSGVQDMLTLLAQIGAYPAPAADA